MPRKAPVVVAPVLDSDPAVGRAWGSLGEPAPDRVERIRGASLSKPALYRLIFDVPGRPAVYAKRSLASDLALERAVYEQVLPRLPLSVPRCFGSCRDDQGSTWLFVEDVGDRRPSEDSIHRRLAARWLATLHLSAADEPNAARLPDAGAPRYLAALRAGRAGIVRNLGNRAMTAADHVILAAMLDELAALESRWPEIERACQGLPVTLVHGDFRSKNVRVRGEGAEETLYALDWEMAGWGVPAADLGSALQPIAMTAPIDADAYRDAVRDTWDLDDHAFQRLAVLGRIFQTLAGVEWASQSLIFESVSHLIRPVSQMRVYRTQILHALEAGEESLR